MLFLLKKYHTFNKFLLNLRVTLHNGLIFIPIITPVMSSMMCIILTN